MLTIPKLTALAAALTVSLAAAQMDMGAGGEMKMGGTAMASLEKKTGKAFDIAYMSQMIEHHRGAIAMARLEVKNGKRADVKAAARKIIDDQEKEINELTGFLKRFYNTSPGKAEAAMMKADMKPMMDATMKGMAPMAGMAMNVDRTFLQGMIPHHQGAIDMSKPALEKAARPEVKSFARGVIAAQSREIKQFKAWLAAGY